jgi:adenine-specific DNA-methyltransferase
VYDPTAGEICNGSVDEIACWFIDTNHNDESFFVRHRDANPCRMV